jgi:hypothetical protein
MMTSCDIGCQKETAVFEKNGTIMGL